MLRIVDVKTFIDTRSIRTAAFRAQRKPLYHIGGFLRRTIRRSMRKRKKASAPGTPPSVHSGELKNSILYSVTSNPSVVIGPSARWRQSDAHGLRGATLHEFGGTRPAMGKIAVQAFSIGNAGPIESRGRVAWIRLKTARQAASATRTYRRLYPGKPILVSVTSGRMLRYPARPYVRPALRNSLGWIRQNYPQHFKTAFQAASQTGSFRGSLAA